MTGTLTSSDGILVTTDSNGDYVLNNLESGDIVQVSTITGFNRIEIENHAEGANIDSGDGFSIRNFQLQTEIEGGDVNFSLDVGVSDEDGDEDTSTIDVTLTPEAAAPSILKAFETERLDLRMQDNFTEAALIAGGLMVMIQDVLALPQEFEAFNSNAESYESNTAVQSDALETEFETLDSPEFNLGSDVFNPIKDFGSDHGTIKVGESEPNMVAEYETAESSPLQMDNPQDDSDIFAETSIIESAISGDELVIFIDDASPNNTGEAQMVNLSEILDVDSVVDIAMMTASENNPAAVIDVTGIANPTQNIASTSSFDPADDLQMLQIATMAIVT